VDRCASAWLIKRFIDKEAIFEFVSKDSEIPKGAIGFTLPKAEISPVEGVKTTFDVLLEKYKVEELVTFSIFSSSLAAFGCKSTVKPTRTPQAE